MKPQTGVDRAPPAVRVLGAIAAQPGTRIDPSALVTDSRSLLIVSKARQPDANMLDVGVVRPLACPAGSFLASPARGRCPRAGSRHPVDRPERCVPRAGRRSGRNCAGLIVYVISRAP